MLFSFLFLQPFTLPFIQVLNLQLFAFPKLMLKFMLLTKHLDGPLENLGRNLLLDDVSSSAFVNIVLS